MMKKRWNAFWSFAGDKKYLLLLLLTAICGYGYKVTHFTIGIDDTPSLYYFDEGLAAIVGRWVMFLLNKVVHVAELTPFLPDLAGVLILMAAVTVWCALFYDILGDWLPKAGYYFFACIFLSCPLISEVYTYYLHNAIAIGYLCCGLSLWLFRQKGIKKYLLSAVLLWIGVGCYESFMVVWLLGVCLILMTERIAKNRVSVWKKLGIAIGVALLAMVMRSVMIAAVTKVFGLEYLKEAAIQRSVTEMAGWLFEPGAFSELSMVLKRLFVMYGVFGYAYYPIKIFVFASVFIVGYSIYRMIRNRDLWIAVLCLGSFMVSFLLAIVEGKATYYRSAQFLPVICGYGVLLFVYACRGLWKEPRQSKGIRYRACRAGKGVVVVMLSAVLWNQCMDMTHWFYVDDMKYQNAKEMVSRISYDLESKFDTNKPVIFTNTWEVPKGIIGDAYVAYGSKTYYKMKRITDMVDEHLLEKFNRGYGVWVAQTPALSVIDWGRYAFDSDAELTTFFSLHGHELVPLTDISLYQDIEVMSLSLPQYPQEGYIVDIGDYIIVHL